MQSRSLAPVRKSAGRFVVGAPRVPVPDVGGEESIETLRRFLVRQKQRRRLRRQAGQRTRFFEGDDFGAHVPARRIGVIISFITRLCGQEGKTENPPPTGRQAQGEGRLSLRAAQFGVWGATEQRKQLRSNVLSLSCLDQELYFIRMTHL